MRIPPAFALPRQLQVPGASALLLSAIFALAPANPIIGSTLLRAAVSSSRPLCLLPVTPGIACCLTAIAAAATAAPPLTVIHLFSDDQTARAIGYENTGMITPHPDQLVREGVRLTNHYNTAAICMASRCNVLTGLYEYRHGCNFDHGDLTRRFLQQSNPAIFPKYSDFDHRTRRWRNPSWAAA